MNIADFTIETIGNVQEWAEGANVYVAIAHRANNARAALAEALEGWINERS